MTSRFNKPRNAAIIRHHGLVPLCFEFQQITSWGEPHYRAKFPFLSDSTKQENLRLAERREKYPLFWNKWKPDMRGEYFTGACAFSTRNRDFLKLENRKGLPIWLRPSQQPLSDFASEHCAFPSPRGSSRSHNSQIYRPRTCLNCKPDWTLLNGNPGLDETEDPPETASRWTLLEQDPRLDENRSIDTGIATTRSSDFSR